MRRRAPLGSFTACVRSKTLLRSGTVAVFIAVSLLAFTPGEARRAAPFQDNEIVIARILLSSGKLTHRLVRIVRFVPEGECIKPRVRNVGNGDGVLNRLLPPAMTVDGFVVTPLMTAPEGGDLDEAIVVGAEEENLWIPLSWIVRSRGRPAPAKLDLTREGSPKGTDRLGGVFQAVRKLFGGWEEDADVLRGAFVKATGMNLTMIALSPRPLDLPLDEYFTLVLDRSKRTWRFYLPQNLNARRRKDLKNSEHLLPRGEGNSTGL
ncbi:MAG: hypothetical protein HY548_07590, partial [Elusimicrobia bacterium]|nr:hypothetical protein [Elusimicrobiota bacterium]